MLTLECFPLRWFISEGKRTRKTFTDLLVSTDRGIAFFDHEDSDEPSTILLDSVGFSNAVCSEHSVGSDAAESVLVVFGLSKKGDLYSRANAVRTSSSFQRLQFPSVPIRDSCLAA